MYIEKPPVIKSIFATRLAEARRAAGYTQAELAEILDVNFMSLVRWENDYYEPKNGVFVRIVKALGVSADWILGWRTDDG